MRYLRILGLAAVAALALTAFAGAGTAAAETTPCKEAVETCTSSWGVGTEVEAMSIAGGPEEVSTLVFTTGSFFAQNVACTGDLKGKIENTTTPSGKGEAFWTNCTGAEAVSTVTNGTIAIHHDSGYNGVVTIKGFVIYVRQSGVDCYYRGEATGTLTAGEKPIIHITQELPKVNLPNEVSSMLCPATVKMHATYEVIKPRPLYVSTGV